MFGYTPAVLGLRKLKQKPQESETSLNYILIPFKMSTHTHTYTHRGQNKTAMLTTQIINEYYRDSAVKYTVQL